MYYAVNNSSVSSNLYTQQLVVDFIKYFYSGQPLAKEYFREELKSLTKQKIEITQYGSTQRKQECTR